MNSHCLLYWNCIWQLWRHFSWLGRSHWTSQPPFLWFCDVFFFPFFLQESKHLLQPLLSTVLSYIHSRSFWWPVFQSSLSVETETFGRDIKNGSGQWFLELPQQVCQSVPSAVHMRAFSVRAAATVGSWAAFCWKGVAVWEDSWCSEVVVEEVWDSLSQVPRATTGSEPLAWHMRGLLSASFISEYTCSEREKPYFPLQLWELGESPGLWGTAWYSLLGIHFLLLL